MRATLVVAVAALTGGCSPSGQSQWAIAGAPVVFQAYQAVAAPYPTATQQFPPPLNPPAVALPAGSWGVAKSDTVGSSYFAKNPLPTANTETPIPSTRITTIEQKEETPALGEQAFGNLVKKYANLFSSAPNQMAAGALRPARAKDICSLGVDDVSDWLATISMLSSTNSGLGVLEVKIDESTSLTTSVSELGDDGYGTLIPISSSVFKNASSMKVGDRVVISGEFIPDREDCIKETSLSVTGDMTDPEFLFRFTSLKPSPDITPAAQP